jgi:hypothetical protein
MYTRRRTYARARVHITYAASSHGTHHICSICIHMYAAYVYMHASSHTCTRTCAYHVCVVVTWYTPCMHHMYTCTRTCAYHVCVVAHHARTMHAHRMHTASVTHAHNIYVTCAHHIHDMHVRCTVRARALPYTCTFAWFSCTPRHRYVPRGKH